MEVLSSSTEWYLIIHGLSTVGAVIVFMLRNEHRVTKLDTNLDRIMREHDDITRKYGGYHEPCSRSAND